MLNKGAVGKAVAGFPMSHFLPEAHMLVHFTGCEVDPIQRGVPMAA